MIDEIWRDFFLYFAFAIFAIVNSAVYYSFYREQKNRERKKDK